MAAPIQFLLAAIAGAAGLVLYFAFRLYLELRMDRAYRQLVRDVRRLEARLNEMEMVDRVRPFLAPIPMMN